MAPQRGPALENGHQDTSVLLTGTKDFAWSVQDLDLARTVVHLVIRVRASSMVVPERICVTREPAQLRKECQALN